jgi:murein DD-endopeptidase MepM/ murein hydrolase activator NlpD
VPAAGASAGAEAVAAAAPVVEKPIYPVPAAHISDEWGATAGRANAHGGLDLANPSGTDIKAALSGTVIEATSSGGWGNEVLIDHHNGLFTRYAHQSEMLVTPGQEVKQGDVIGKVGSTGNSSGPHLHFEVMEGGTGPANRRDSHVWLDTGRLTADVNPDAAH